MINNNNNNFRYFVVFNIMSTVTFILENFVACIVATSKTIKLFELSILYIFNFIEKANLCFYSKYLNV